MGAVRTFPTVRLVNGSTGDPVLYLADPGPGTALLFDGGDNCALSTDELGALEAVFVTHHHVDHFIGLDRIVRANIDCDKTLHLFGPEHTIRRVWDRVRSYEYPFFPFMKLRLRVHELLPGRVRVGELSCEERWAEPTVRELRRADRVCYETDRLRVETVPVDHTVPCWAYALVEKAGRSRRVRVAFVTDTFWSGAVRPELVKLCRGAERLYCDSFYASAQAEQAAKHRHMMAPQAAELAKRAKVGELVLMHFSTRYAGAYEQLVEEARAVFPNVRADLSPHWGDRRSSGRWYPMSESELQNLIAAPEPPADEPAPVKADLAPDQALELIRAGKAVENARVERLKLRGDFEQPVRFRNCVLVQCEFDGATFRQDVAFIACTLDRPAFPKPSTFEKNLDLSHSIVNKAIVTRLTVRGKLFASHAEFRGKAIFADCAFHQGASFWEAKFATWVDFKGCEFRDTADFRSVSCDQGFVLTKSVFLGDFLFRGSCVEKKFQADGSRFEKLLDLSKAKLHDYVYLEAIDQGPAQSFAFLNAVAERIRVRPEQVEGRLDSEAAGRHEEAMQEYGLLKQCYQALHRFDSEDWAFYRFKVNQRKAKTLSWARPWTVWRAFGDWLFLDVGCGYGTSPARAVRMALVIILGFAALYAANVEMFYTERVPFPDAGEKEAPANRVMIGLVTSVSVFTSGMGGIREVATRGWMNVPVMVESIMGTLLFGLFIVAFSRKVIR